MTQEEIQNQVQLIFRDVLKRDNVEITERSTVKDIKGWDSLTHMLIIAQIEKTFGVRFNFREIVKFENVGDLCKSIQTKTV